MEKEER